jgi:serine/threonine protein kinase/WD40 repeat protein
MAMPDDSVLLGELAEEFSAKVRQGQMPRIEEYAQKHPSLAERIRALFPTLLFLEGMAGGKSKPSGARGEASASLSPGSQFGNFRIEREVGRGGMGVVYEATHLALNKRVALKVLPVQGPRDASHLERFLREAQTAAALHHTNIVPVFDVGQIEGIPYYAMQFIEGCGLDRVMQEKQGGTGADAPTVAPSAPLSLAPGESPALLATQEITSRPMGRGYFQWVAEMGIQAAEGLAHAHQRGVIHRDIKPSNLILDQQGVLWITDFGLARRSDDPALTHSGAILGTPRYMSPEQAEAARRPIDHRTDVYSLGATLYELLTRRPAFDGPTPLEIVLQILERNPVSPRKLDPSIPRDLETIVLKAMARRPEDRYASAANLADDLKRWQRVEPIRARRISPITRLVRWCQRNPAMAGMVLALMVSLVAGTVIAWVLAARAERRDRDALVAVKAAELNEERARDELCVGLYHRAQGELISKRPGRRWLMLELLREAEKLRARNRPETSVTLPSRVDLRSLAVEALAIEDARVLRESHGGILGGDMAVTPDGRWGARQWHDLPSRRRGIRVTDLDTGKDAASWEDTNFLTFVTLSPDGQRVAHWNKVNQIRLLELPSCKELATLSPSGAKDATKVGPGPMAFSRSGRLLAAQWSEEKGPRLSLFEFKEGGPRPLGDLDGVGGGWIAFDPKERWLAAPADDDEIGSRKVGLWDLATRKKTREIGLPAVSFVPPAVSPDGGLMLIACGDIQAQRKTVLVWNVDEGRKEGEWAIDSQLVMGLAFDPSGKRVIVSPGMTNMAFIDPLTGKESTRIEMAHKVPIRQFFWHSEGRELTSVGFEGVIRRWELSPPPARSVVDVRGRNAVISPDGKWLASTPRKEQKTYLVRRATGKVEREIPAAGSQLLFSPDSKRIVVGGYQAVRLFEVETGREEPLRHNVKTAWASFAFTPDGRLLGAGSRGVDYLVWDISNDREVWKHDVVTELGGIALSPDGTRVLTQEGTRLDSSRVCVWELPSGKRLAEVPAPATMFAIQKPQISADGRWLAVSNMSGLTETGSDRENSLSVWSVPEGKRVLHIPFEVLPGMYQISPDGRRLATSDVDGVVRLWDVERGEELFRWKAVERFIDRVQFTPDGEALVVAADMETELRVLDLSALRGPLAEIGLQFTAEDAEERRGKTR